MAGPTLRARPGARIGETTQLSRPIALAGYAENFGNIGQSMVTMFVLLTLENLPVYIEMGQELSNWTLLFFISYVLIASFLIFNPFIGIVINSMEEAREIELHKAERALVDGDDANDEQAHAVILRERLHALKHAVEALERELAAQRRAG